MSVHNCTTCEACIHDGRKCCGCYDGACCQPATNPCGHRTRHTSRVGCCAACKRLFSSDSAFDRHRKRGGCLNPTDRGLVAKPSKQYPAETIWSLAPGSSTWRDAS